MEYIIFLSLLVAGTNAYADSCVEMEARYKSMPSHADELIARRVDFKHAFACARTIPISSLRHRSVLCRWIRQRERYESSCVLAIGGSWQSCLRDTEGL